MWLAAAATPSANAWHQIAYATTDGGSGRRVLYVDDVANPATVNYPDPSFWPTGYIIGSNSTSGASYGSSGSLDEFRLSNIARSADWIATEYNNQSSPATFSYLGPDQPAAQAAAPTLNPAGGSYSTAQSVTISANTAGATVRYTLDGSTPSETAGTMYSGPVTISGTTTLKAIAYESGMQDSTVTSGTYVIGSGAVTILPACSIWRWGTRIPIQALNSAGQPVAGLTWTSSNPSVVSLSTDDPPVLTAVAAGHATITAGAASASVTVVRARCRWARCCGQIRATDRG